MRIVVLGAIGFLLASPAVAGPRLLTGEPEYEDAEARELVEAMVAAHGGASAFDEATGLSFSFVTKVIGNGAAPFISTERTNLRDGTSRVEYPRWNAVIGYDGEEIWSQNWPIPLPPGFFAGLTTSFITLPWITQRSDANIAKPRLGLMPDHNELYHVVKVTFDSAGPHVPGEFYELFIDRESKLVEGVGFNITHPQMTRVASQPLGPNYHRFLEYVEIGQAVIPSYYITHGHNSANGGIVEAMHAVFDIRLDDLLRIDEVSRPEGGEIDEATSAWWAAPVR